jgi:hypothetical protein
MEPRRSEAAKKEWRAEAASKLAAAFVQKEADRGIATIQWHPVAGPKLPDDEITVLCGWSKDQNVEPGFMLGGKWRNYEGLQYSQAPDCWAHVPEVPALPSASAASAAVQ